MRRAPAYQCGPGADQHELTDMVGRVEDSVEAIEIAKVEILRVHDPPSEIMRKDDRGSRNNGEDDGAGGQNNPQDPRHVLGILHLRHDCANPTEGEHRAYQSAERKYWDG